MASTSPQHLGKYELQERLGHGGMGEVWKAFDPQLRRYVAIKLLRADLQDDGIFMTRFHREAQMVASLHHPNIIQIYDAHIPLPSENDKSTAYMVMDYVPGKTLADYIRITSRAGKFPPREEIVHLFIPISLAIDYAHQNGLIHRDIKPANILLDARNTMRNPMGEPLLTDFGLVKPVGEATSALTHASIGTPLYISPEQAQGHSGNERSDIYSLGIILYEIFTGITPFHGNNPFEIMLQHVKTLATPPSLINPNIPPAVNEVILRSIAKDPARRFPSASSMTAALAEALALPVPENLSPPGYPIRTENMPTQFESLASSSAKQSPQGSPSPAALSVNTPLPEVSPGFAPGAAMPVPRSPVPADASPQSPPAVATVPPTPPLPAIATPPSSKQPRDRRTRLIQVGLIALLLIVLVGSGVGALLVFHPWSPAISSSQFVGHASFLSSGNLDLTQASAPGLNDELQVDLQNVPPPANGKAYYAWLVKDNEGGIILLGKLAVNSGQVHFRYPGDQQHSNLLATTNSLLITEEDANTTPGNPSVTPQYQAMFSQTRAADGFSVLDHLRHLLSGEQALDNLGLHGGLDIWLLRNTAKVSGWAGIARDYWNGNNTNLQFIRGQITHLLDVLAGTHNDTRDARIARIALIGTPNQTPPDHVDHTINHLDALTRASGATQEQRQLANTLEGSLRQVKILLGQANNDAKQLNGMTDQQLTGPLGLSLLNDMATAADKAYLGQFDPATSKVQQEGVAQIYIDIQRLATFDLAPP
jgi:eukaryotic-like serine/threonine-protein kinase